MNKCKSCIYYHVVSYYHSVGNNVHGYRGRCVIPANQEELWGDSGGMGNEFFRYLASILELLSGDMDACKFFTSKEEE